MVLIRKQSACATKNMQEMQSLNCQRYCVGCSSGSRRCPRQMWVVGVILLLTTIIFTVNAEQTHAQRHNDGSLRTHFVDDDNLQVSQMLPKKHGFVNIIIKKISKNKRKEKFPLHKHTANSILLVSEIAFRFFFCTPAWFFASFNFCSYAYISKWQMALCKSNGRKFAQYSRINLDKWLYGTCKR